MIEKIKKELERRFENCKNKVFPYAELEMKNGDEVTVEAPTTWVNCIYGNKDYSIITDDNEVIHFSDLTAVSTWIYEKYCK